MVFTLTSVRFKDESDFISRCFGYYLDYETAVKAVLENRCDMYETIYTHLVIEQVFPGVHSTPNFETWFKYDIIECKWVNCFKPKELRRYKGFSMG